MDALADDMPEDLAARIAEARTALDEPAVEYEGTMAAKLSIARALFDRRGASEMEVSSVSFSALKDLSVFKTTGPR